MGEEIPVEAKIIAWMICVPAWCGNVVAAVWCAQRIVGVPHDWLQCVAFAAVAAVVGGAVRYAWIRLSLDFLEWARVFAGEERE